MSEAKDITGLLRRAFLEGFKVSGEGWNGEYPFEGYSDEVVMGELEEYFRREYPEGGWHENYG